MVRKFVMNVLWPESALDKLGRVLGALSLLGVFRIGFGLGLVAAIEHIYLYYEHLLSVLVGWTEPWIRSQLADLGRFLKVSLHLDSHWKHISVLLSIYFFREVGLGFRLYGAGYAIFNGLVGLLIAVAFGVATGAVPNIPSSALAQFLIGALPVLGAAAYGIVTFAWDATYIRESQARTRHMPVPTWWGHYRWGLTRVANRSVGGLILLWGLLRIPAIQRLPEPGLAAFALLVLALACYWLVDGAFEAEKIRLPGEDWGEAYMRAGFTQLGMAMIGSFFWVLLALVASAGLVAFGL